MTNKIHMLKRTLKNARKYNIAVLIFVIFIAVLFLVPMWFFLQISFRPGSAVFRNPPSWFPSSFAEVNFRGYLAIFKQGFQPKSFFSCLLRSLMVSSTVSLSLLFYSCLSGYAYARLKFRGRNVMFYMILVSFLFPQQVTVVPYFRLMTILNLTNTLWSIVFPAFFGASCQGCVTVFGIFMLRQFYLTIPKDLEEAGYIDGAGPITTYFRIIFPISMPAVISIGIMFFVWSWNDSMYARIMLYYPEKYILSMLGRGTAAVFVAVLPAFIMYIFFQKWIINNMMNSGIKR